MNENNVQVVITGLAYDEAECFLYREPTRLFRDASGKVNFSILIHVKQRQLLPNSKIQLVLIHLIDEPIDDRKQSITAVDLGCDIPLDKADVTYNRTMRASMKLKNDDWTIRQAFKWNLSSVPTEGPGTYAVAAFLVTYSGENKHRKFLDAHYIDIL